MAMFKKGEKETHHKEPTHAKEAAPEKATPAKKAAAKETHFSADEVLALLRKEHADLLAFAHTPEASKSDASIDANSKAAFLEEVIKKVEAAASAASEG